MLRNKIIVIFQNSLDTIYTILINMGDIMPVLGLEMRLPLLIERIGNAFGGI